MTTTAMQQPPAATALDRVGETTTLAVSYLRVSTKEQASKGGRDEGFSIPAQREANLRKARELNAIITVHGRGKVPTGGHVRSPRVAK